MSCGPCRKLKKNEPKEKKQLKFMQKYYHKGAFYMDDSSVRDKEDVRKRDASEATLEDKFNKEMLPQVMQVKNFGRAGRYVTVRCLCTAICFPDLESSSITAPNTRILQTKTRRRASRYGTATTASVTSTYTRWVECVIWRRSVERRSSASDPTRAKRCHTFV